MISRRESERKFPYGCLVFFINQCFFTKRFFNKRYNQRLAEVQKIGGRQSPMGVRPGSDAAGSKVAGFRAQLKEPTRN